MKSIRNIAFSALLTFAAFSAVTYTSCNKDECKEVVCNNGGTCDQDTGACICATGYEGEFCDDKVRDKFIGSWKGSDVCSKNTYPITLTVKNSTDNIQALVDNPGGFGGTVTITGTVSGTDKLVFTNQSVDKGRTLNGTMTFNGASMTFSYTVTGALDTDNCNGTYAKQ